MMTAAHIFPHKFGQDSMSSIFDLEDPKNPELLSPLNGILMSSRAEKLFDSGAFVIVPKVSSYASPAEMRAWNLETVKSYKIRFIET